MALELNLKLKPKREPKKVDVIIPMGRIIIERSADKKTIRGTIKFNEQAVAILNLVTTSLPDRPTKLQTINIQTGTDEGQKFALVFNSTSLGDTVYQNKPSKKYKYSLKEDDLRAIYEANSLLLERNYDFELLPKGKETIAGVEVELYALVKLNLFIEKEKTPKQLEQQKAISIWCAEQGKLNLPNKIQDYWKAHEKN